MAAPQFKSFANHWQNAVPSSERGTGNFPPQWKAGCIQADYHP
jgi:hypothetical protein